MSGPVFVEPDPELSADEAEAVARLMGVDEGGGDLFEALEAARDELGRSWPVVAWSVGACPVHGCDVDICLDDGEHTPVLSPCAGCGHLVGEVDERGVCGWCTAEG